MNLKSIIILGLSVSYFTACTSNEVLATSNSSDTSQIASSDESSSESSETSSVTNTPSSSQSNENKISSGNNPHDVESSEVTERQSSEGTDSESSSSGVVESSTDSAGLSSTEIKGESSEEIELESSSTPYTGTGINAFAKIEAESGEVVAGDVDLTGGGGTHIRVFQDGDILKYADIDFGSGASSFLIHLTQGFPDATLDLMLDSQTAEPFATIEIQSTGGWNNFETQIENIPNVDGVHDLYIAAHHDGGAGDIDWIRFSEDEVIVPTAPAGLSGIAPTDFSIDLLWSDLADNETAYYVYWDANGNKPSQPDTIIAANTTSFTIDNLDPGTPYSIWVAAATSIVASEAATTSVTTSGTKPVPQITVKKDEGEWSYLVIPDTQYYTHGGQESDPQDFRDGVQWIVNNKDALNLKIVTHLGDVVDWGPDTGAWGIAKDAMSKLDGVVPYAFSLGNHDGDGSSWGGTNLVWDSDIYNNFNGNFPVSLYDFYEWHGGTKEADSYKNSYQLLEIGGMKYMIINIEYAGRNGSLDWMHQQIEAHPNHKVIAAFHDNAAYTGVDQFDNVFMTVGGHHGSREQYWTTETPASNTVHHLLTDYQWDKDANPEWTKGRNTFRLRWYVFKPLKNKVCAVTYSFILDEFETDANSQFCFDFLQ